MAQASVIHPSLLWVENAPMVAVPENEPEAQTAEEPQLETVQDQVSGLSRLTVDADTLETAVSASLDKIDLDMSQRDGDCVDETDEDTHVVNGSEASVYHVQEESDDDVDVFGNELEGSSEF